MGKFKPGDLVRLRSGCTIPSLWRITNEAGVQCRSVKFEGVYDRRLVPCGSLATVVEGKPHATLVEGDEVAVMFWAYPGDIAESFEPGAFELVEEYRHE